MTAKTDLSICAQHGLPSEDAKLFALDVAEPLITKGTYLHLQHVIVFHGRGGARLNKLRKERKKPIRHNLQQRTK